MPATFAVTSLADSGTGTLRQAITQANAAPGADAIVFDPTVRGTITLLAALPDLSTDIRLEGPGASALSIARSLDPGTPDFRIFTVAAGAEVTIGGLTLTGGRAPDELGPGGFLRTNGGGVLNEGTLSINKSVLAGNSAADFGDGPVQVGFGGGIFNSGTLAVTRSILRDNKAPFGGGGGILNSGTLSLVQSSILNNSGASGASGGIGNSGTLTILASTLAGNTSTNSGGAIDSIGGTASIAGSTFIGNSAGSGGAIYNQDGSLAIVNSTFSGNLAIGFPAADGSIGLADGGAIFNNFGGILTVSASTFAGNRAERDGAIATNANGSTTIESSIFAAGPGGTVANPFGEDTTSLGHNLFTDSPAIALDSTDLSGADPLLAPLGDYGGPTSTFALLPGSPAIDAGTSIPGLTTDQRGVARPQGATPDIGAFESQGFTLALISGDGQTAHALSPFASPLVVAVASPFGEPVTGGLVTFIAPASGASATFSGNQAVIGPDGTASVAASANGTGGTFAVVAQAPGTPGAIFTLTNIGPVSPIGLAPTVTDLQRFGFHRRPTQIVLGFSGPLDPSRAQDLGNYGLFALGGGHARSIRLGSATYDDAFQSVTLRPTRRLGLNGTYRLTVNGRPPAGLTGPTGVPLDGTGDGQPGTDYVATFDRSAAVLPPPRGLLAVVAASPRQQALAFFRSRLVTIANGRV